MNRVLVVDGDPLFNSLACESLRRHGMTPLSVADPLEGFALACNQEPDAILLDVRLPRHSGWEILSRLRGEPRCRPIPVLLMSQHVNTADRLRGLRGGADDYLDKNGDFEEVIARIETLVERRRALREADSQSPLQEVFNEIESRIVLGGPLTGISIGRYEVLGQLGNGAAGRVLAARDTRLGRPVALKIIRFESSLDQQEERAARLVEEALQAAVFQHPHIVAIYDVEKEGPAVFIAMELVAGVTLNEVVMRGRLRAEELLPVAAAVALALAAAHGAGMVHRDIKPSNVLLDREGRIKVADFGLAASIAAVRENPQICGTSGFIAPEIFFGRPNTEASDLFSLGVLIYHGLAGHPFRDRSDFHTMNRTISDTPPPLIEVRPEVPQWLSDLVVRLLEKDPERRPKDAAALAEQLVERCEDAHLRWDRETYRRVADARLLK